MEAIIIEDLKRYANGKMPRVQYLFRKYQVTTGVFRHYYHLLYHIYQHKYFIGIPVSTRIGPGLYMGHYYGITVSSDAIIGKNCNIHKGATVGRENRGQRKGAPHIGDSVYIGINSTIVGAVSIGEDVLIASNTFVNCDVPSHSIVIGNPCCIIHKENATEGYINNKVD